jgi:hypothetical protein
MKSDLSRRTRKDRLEADRQPSKSPVTPITSYKALVSTKINVKSVLTSRTPSYADTADIESNPEEASSPQSRNFENLHSSTMPNISALVGRLGKPGRRLKGPASQKHRAIDCIAFLKTLCYVVKSSVDMSRYRGTLY